MVNTSKHEILVVNVWTAQTGCWDATVSQFADMRVQRRETREDRQPKLLHGEGMSSLLRKLSTCKHQVTTEILYTFHYMSGWLNGEHILSAQRGEQSFLLLPSETQESFSSSTEVKISWNILSGTTSMSKPRNMACLIASAAYKQFSSLVERGKMRCENPQRPRGSYN